MSKKTVKIASIDTNVLLIILLLLDFSTLKIEFANYFPLTLEKIVYTSSKSPAYFLPQVGTLQHAVNLRLL
jgi:hypothetical protein